MEIGDTKHTPAESLWPYRNSRRQALHTSADVSITSRIPMITLDGKQASEVQSRRWINLIFAAIIQHLMGKP
jgi:hypothetical protein